MSSDTNNQLSKVIDLLAINDPMREFLPLGIYEFTDENEPEKHIRLFIKNGSFSIYIQREGRWQLWGTGTDLKYFPESVEFFRE